jgi:Mn2+/Fe2+ NRAMP family transporter
MGCTAYQAGNLKGALSGIQLLLPFSNVTGMVLMVSIIIPVLWFPGFKRILKFLGIMVLAMALVFLIVVFKADYNWNELLYKGLVPGIPLGADILVIAMLGTTIVPYNLFLGAGLAKNQPLKEMRFGLIISILLGGFITFIIYLAGTLNLPDPTFEDVLATVTSRGGSWSGILFALGLALAGFTSAVTAPLAAAITFETLLGKEFSQVWIFRSIWLVVVLTGFIIGISGWQPIPVIIIAQAINGLLIPFLAVYLFILLNDRKIVPAGFQNSWWLDGVFALITYIIVALGLFHFFRILTSLIEYKPGTRNLYLLAGLISLFLIAVSFRKIFLSKAD